MQPTPILTFDPVPFKMGIAKLQEHRFGSKMRNYQNPTDDDRRRYFRRERA